MHLPAAEGAAPANLKGPEAVIESRDGEQPGPTHLDTRQAWEREKLQLVLDRLASGTRKSYSLGWRWWALFCRARGVHPYRKVTAENAQAEEELFLDFVVHLATHGRKAVGTVKQHLSVVRAQHLAQAYPDPTKPLLRVWWAIDGLRRRQKGPKRKKPVTKEMLLWIRQGLDPERRHDDAVIRAAIMLAFFFLL